jgi:hypothetical protein
LNAYSTQEHLKCKTYASSKRQIDRAACHIRVLRAPIRHAVLVLLVIHSPTFRKDKMTNWTETPYLAGVKFETTIRGELLANLLRKKVNRWIKSIYVTSKNAEARGASSLLRFAERKPPSSLMELTVYIVDPAAVADFKQTFAHAPMRNLTWKEYDNNDGYFEFYANVGDDPSEAQAVWEQLDEWLAEAFGSGECEIVSPEESMSGAFGIRVTVEGKHMARDFAHHFC